MKFIKRQDGQGLVEYALLLVLIAVVVIAALMLLGPQIRSTFAQVIGALGGAGNFDYAVSGSATLTETPNGFNCEITVSNLTVTVTDLGEPVPDLIVSATATSAGNWSGGKSIQAKTNASGVANFGGKTFTIGESCGSISGPVTISIAGGVQTVNTSLP